MLIAGAMATGGANGVTVAVGANIGVMATAGALAEPMGVDASELVVGLEQPNVIASNKKVGMASSFNMIKSLPFDGSRL